MAFKFPLATVLRVRGIIEEREEGILQKILFDISQTFDGLERIETQIAESDAARLADIFKPSFGRDLHASYGEVGELKQRRKDLEARIQQLEQARDVQLLVYEAARRDREMLTDMRQKKRTAYDSDMSRSEQKTLDDNYNARRGRG
jgi:flagellar export protein FliJ